MILLCHFEHESMMFVMIARKPLSHALTTRYTLATIGGLYICDCGHRCKAYCGFWVKVVVLRHDDAES